MKGVGNHEVAAYVEQARPEGINATLRAIWTEIHAEIGNSGAGRLATLVGDDEWILKAVISNYVTASLRPAFNRGSIEQIASRVNSLSRKSKGIAAEIDDVAASLKGNPRGGLNLVSLGVSDAAQEVVSAVERLRRAMERLQEARDEFIPDNGLRRNEARYRLARELALFFGDTADADADAHDLLWTVLAVAVEAVEGKGGRLEREWVAPLLRSVRMAEET